MTARADVSDPVALGKQLEEIGSRMVKLGVRTQLFGDLMSSAIATELDGIATGAFQLSIRIRALTERGKAA